MTTFTAAQDAAPGAASANELSWTTLDQRAVDTVRVLAADAVEKVGNGHPGTAMSLAPAAYLLFQKLMRHDPANPDWLGRDRFVLSPGHTSLTLYIQLFLSGYGLELKDLEALRTWGSLTPGHPEYKHTRGVEITTGPLGQGLASAVGFAYSQRRMRGLFDADAPAGASPFDHTVWVIASDGDLQEGVTSEASSLAGHQELGNLVVIYDENHISIEDDTDVAFTEDVLARYEAYGWHTQRVDWTRTGEYKEDVAELHAALLAAKAETSKPSIISLRTIIGYPAPKKQNTGKIHGSALGSEEVAALKKVLGFDPERAFQVDADVLSHARAVQERGAAARAEWQASFEAWQVANPDAAALLERVEAKKLPGEFEDALPVFEAGKDVSTRAASGKVLNAIGPVMPELWGGSADLAESNNTTIEGSPSFIPASRSTGAWKGNPYGRVLHFGIREHAAASIVNGISLHGRTRAFSGTFLIFSDYQRPAIRLGALMGVPSLYVWTHDSIGLGEDGPTHQPVEQLASLRAIPGLDVVRPGGRERGRRGLEGHAGKPREPGRDRPDPAEHPHLRPRHVRGLRRHVRLHRRRREGRLRPGRSVEGRCHGPGAGHPDRHRLRGPARRERPRGAAGRGHPHPCGVHALRGVVQQAGPRLPRGRAPRQP